MPHLALGGKKLAFLCGCLLHRPGQLLCGLGRPGLWRVIAARFDIVHLFCFVGPLLCWNGNSILVIVDIVVVSLLLVMGSL